MLENRMMKILLNMGLSLERKFQCPDYIEHPINDLWITKPRVTSTVQAVGKMLSGSTYRTLGSWENLRKL
ncbi:hypothetical protein M8J76_011193 [Diaphorina citri]|nr:hypothetical protein M8J76_011193 [Diaphorina citri]